MKFNVPQGKERLADLIKGYRVGMLTTTEDDGTLRSRPMLTYSSGLGVLWLFSRADTPKVEEARKNNHVNITYADSLADHYVSISGRAELEQDKGRMKELWNPSFKAWFPAGLNEPNLTLMRVVIQKAELWEARSTMVGQLLAVAKNLAGRGDHHTPIHEKLDFGTVSP